MSDSEPINLFGAGYTKEPVPASSHSGHKFQPNIVSFNKRELNEILRLYGRRVAAGEWRDYAIDTLKERAVFSIYRRTSEMPLYRIVKQPKLSRKQGAYSVLTPTGLILRRGQNLLQVLRAIDRTPKLVTA